MEKPSARSYQYLFGPVRSRRLGVSLGVDLMPHKTCTLDCVYCECGKTTRKTLVRKEYIPIRSIQDELNDFLSPEPELDHVTFSGAGEPTLHTGIGALIDFLKKDHPRYSVALLTNGTLLKDPQVREAIAGADAVIASLDAATPGGLKAVNRPHAGLSATEVIQGLVDFRKGFSRKFIIEIFIVPGVNDTENELAALKDALKKIRPDAVHLNTLDRPGTESWVRPAEERALKSIADSLGGAGVAQFIPGGCSKKIRSAISDEQLLDTLRRRPFTAEDMAAIFEIESVEAQDRLERLAAAGRAVKKQMQRGIFYSRKNT